LSEVNTIGLLLFRTICKNSTRYTLSKAQSDGMPCPSGKRAWNLGRELVVFEPFHDGEGYEWHGRTDRMIDGR
jgi:hypothetical protein